MGKDFLSKKVHMCERRGFALPPCTEHLLRHRIHTRAQRVFAIVLAVALILSLCACGKTETGKNNGGSSGKETVQGTTAQGGNGGSGATGSGNESGTTDSGNGSGSGGDATGNGNGSGGGNGGSDVTDSGNGSGGGNGNGGTADASNEKAHSM